MTIHEIAELAGVSISTVSKIINNKDENISPQTRSRVLKIVKDYNYVPYSTVQNNPSVKKFLLGVLLRDAKKNAGILPGILQTAQEHGYCVLLLDSRGDSETEMKHITALCRNGVDGVIWEPVSEGSSSCSQHFSRYGIPFCFINGFSQIPSFHLDFAALSYALTRKLADLKHTDIACIVRKEDEYTSQFVEGFQKCMYDQQLPGADKKIFYALDEEALQSLIHSGVTAILCSRRETAAELYEKLKKYHYEIPQDVSLVCLKEREIVPSYPRISGIALPSCDFGSYVCEEMIRICEKSPGEEPSFTFSPPAVLDCEDTICRPSFLQSKRFVIVGSVNIDSTFHVASLPKSGKTTSIRNLSVAAGGKGANQAAGIARLGGEAVLIAEIGSDMDAAFVFDVLEKENVVTQGVHRNKKARTGKAYIYLGNDGESAITVLAGANAQLHSGDILARQNLFKNASFCLISTEIPTDTVIQAAETAREYSVRTILKPVVLRQLPSRLLSMIDIFIPNREEASVLCPDYSSIEEQAEYFFRQGCPVVIITLGSGGCYLKTENMARYFPASDFVPIDTTGGADAFIAALACYLEDGYSLETSIQISMYAAGFCISRQGIIQSLVDKNTLEAHISKKHPSLLREA